MNMITRIDEQDAVVRSRLPRKRWPYLAAGAFLAAASAGLLVSGQRPAPAAAAATLPTVTVSQPLRQTLLEWEDYTGRFEASQSVDIRPRVTGQLQAVHFRDGDIVRRGQLLFTIDQRPFLAALAEARARAADARTRLALAQSEYARAARLVDDEAVSQEEVDSLRAAMRSGEAGVAAADAVVRQRQLDLEFTQVRAPVTGRISDRRIDVGNLVSANETMLTTLLSLDPIYFSFDGSEALHLKSLRQGDERGAREVDIRLQDESGYQWKGIVDFTDNAIDPGSGTLRGRAVVRNPDYFLTPGMFGNMRLASGAPRASLLVPDAAVQTDQARKVLLVVGADGAVSAKPVELGPRVGTLRAIRSGLGPNDRVVVSGVQYAAPGSKVQMRQVPVQPPPAKEQVERSYTAPAASQATLAAR